LRVSSLTVFQSVNYKTDFTSLLAIDWISVDAQNGVHVTSVPVIQEI
jgi:hypothetical protein